MHLWRRTLFLIAIVAGAVLALMSLAGGNETFSEPWLKRMASGAGLIADIGVPAFLFGMVFFYKRRDWFCFLLSAVFWVACSAYTVKQSSAWLVHTFEADQKPAEQAKKSAEITETQRQTDLETERTTLKEANDVILKGKGNVRGHPASWLRPRGRASRN